MIELCLGAFHAAVTFLTVIRVGLEVLESQMHGSTDKNLQTSVSSKNSAKQSYATDGKLGEPFLPSEVLSSLALGRASIVLPAKIENK